MLGLERVMAPLLERRHPQTQHHACPSSAGPCSSPARQEKEKKREEWKREHLAASDDTRRVALNHESREGLAYHCELLLKEKITEIATER